MLATDVIDKIANEITTRDIYSGFLKEIEGEETDLKDILPEDLAASHIFELAFSLGERGSHRVGGVGGSGGVNELRNPTKAKIMRHLYRQVYTQLTTQSTLVDAIVAKLRLGQMEDEDMRGAIYNYFRTPRQGTIFWGSRPDAAIKTALLRAGPAGIALELQAPEPAHLIMNPKRKVFSNVGETACWADKRERVAPVACLPV